jgi:hypothetical protein
MLLRLDLLGVEMGKIMGEGFWGKWDVDYGYAESCWYLAAYF